MGEVITIDGPAASGKTSVSRELASRLGWSWLSTGAFYRGLAYVATQKNINTTDEESLSQLTQSNEWQVVITPERTEVHYLGRDVTDEITREEIGNVASRISHFPKVRQMLLKNQREMKNKTNGLIAEGRDCGTVVFPEAKHKFYLTAEQFNRAERRAKELGQENVQNLVEQQKLRDIQDSSRKSAPLQVPENAFVIDTSHLTLLEVVSLIEKNIRGTLESNI